MTEAMTKWSEDLPPSGLDKEDMRPPRWRILQPLSKEVSDGLGRPGQIYSSQLGCVDELSLVPLFLGKSRVLFARPEDGGGVLCRSSDAMTPAAGVDAPQSSVCAKRNVGGLEVVCPKAKWLDKQKPQCSLIYNLIAYDVEHHCPALLSFKGSAVKPFLTLANGIVAQFGQLYRGQAVMKTRKASSKTSTWFEPVFENIAPVASEIWDEVVTCIRGFKGYVASDDSSDAPVADDALPF